MNWSDIGKYLNPPMDDNPRPGFRPSSVQGVNMLARYLYTAGGPAQQSRMIRDKRRTLDRALLYSYQGAFVQKADQDRPAKALINPNKLKPDYDEKMISIGFEHDYHTGDVFEWKNTGTYWLIYLQDLTELAYFRGDIRRCNYEIAWLDDDGQEQRTYAAVKGPVETKIDYIQKHLISIDNPNYSLNILLPRTKENLEYFRRYSRFYLQGEDEGSPKVCWRVEATDWISTPGILEINAVEYYANETEDDVEAGIVGALKTEVLNPNTEDVDATIKGETFIKPKVAYEYVFSGSKNNVGSWSVDSNAPVTFEEFRTSVGKKAIRVKWNVTYGGQFDLTYKTGDKEFKKTIVVQSLF